MHRPPAPALPSLRPLPRTPHPSWRNAASGEAPPRRKPDAAEFWARLGA